MESSFFRAVHKSAQPKVIGSQIQQLGNVQTKYVRKGSQKCNPIKYQLGSGCSIVCWSSGMERVQQGAIKNIKEQVEMPSVWLDKQIREQVMDSIDKCNNKVEVSTVSQVSGVSMTDAATALNALAQDSQATMEVLGDGSLRYTFPPGYRSKIRSKSLALSIQPYLEKAQKVGIYVLRVLYGTMLLVSIAVGIMLLIAAASSDNRSKSREGDLDFGSLGQAALGGGNAEEYTGGGGGMYFPRTYWWSFYDPWFQPPLRYYAVPSQPGQVAIQNNNMSILEAISSFVFGDGDINEGFEAARQKRIAELLVHHKGVVTFEQLLPLLDVSVEQVQGWRDEQGGYRDESAVLPVLLRFGGEAVVSESGDVVYVFQEFIDGKSSIFSPKRPFKYNLQESEQPFSIAKGWQKFVAGLLGAVNCYIAVQLSAQTVGMVAVRQQLAAAGVAWLVPGIQIFAAAYVFGAAVHWLQNKIVNDRIANRNQGKAVAATWVNSKQGYVSGKLGRVEKEKSKLIKEYSVDKGVVYRTDQDVLEQSTDYGK